MAWIESHQALSRHRKTLRATAILRVDRHKLLGHLHELWWWALDNVPANGSLYGLSDEEIASGADWQKGADTFVGALVQAGFIDDREDGRFLHDWYDYAGKLNERRVADRERLRQQRSLKGRPSQETRTSVVRQSAEHPPDSPTSVVSTVPNTTQPDTTGPETPPNPPAGGRSGVGRAKRVPHLSDEEREKLVTDYSPVLGKDVVLETIEMVLGHDKARSYENTYLYVRGWLRRDAQKATPPNLRNGKPVSTLAEEDPEVYAHLHKWSQ